MSDQIDLHPIPRPGEGEPKADVIFVHGLGGDPVLTWCHGKDDLRDSWPFWLAEDVPEAQVCCLEYPADWTHWFGGEAMPLFDRAKSVLNLMAARNLGRRPIVFICHSLGGLMVKQLLRQAAEPGAELAWRAIGEQTRGVAFVATPHAGADLARVAERLGLVTQTTPVMADLRAHAPALRGLSEWFRDYVPRTGLRVLCRYETRTTGTKRVSWLGWVVSAGVKVVEEADADPGIVGVTPIPLDADHFGTCKPDHRDRPLCQDVVRLVRVPGAAERKQAGFPMGGLDTKSSEKREVNSLNVKALAVPADALYFQEREDIQDEIIKALRSEQNDVVVIYGIGGGGKTTLAVHVANILMDKFADGQRYVNLEGMHDSPLSPVKAMTELVQSFEETAKVPRKLAAASELYRDVLDRKQVLLILDNAENGEQVGPLLKPRNWGAASFIVTSRQRIIIDGRAPIHLKELTPDEASRFLFNRLGAKRCEGLDLHRLAMRCGRLPLALTVAADFLAQNSNFVSAEQYVSALETGAIAMRLDDEPERDVLAVLGLSISQLARDDPHLSQRWHSLLIFAADFDEAAVADVWDCTKDEARRDLGKLLARSILRFDGLSSRYGLHDLMREAATRLTPGAISVTDGLSEGPQAIFGFRDVEARFARHYCRLLSEANQLYQEGGDKMRQGLALYDLEHRNIAAGQAWAAAHINGSRDIARLTADYAGAGVDILDLRLARDEWIDWLEAQLTACRQLGDRRGESQALNNLGLAWFDRGEARRAIEYHEQDLAITREMTDRQGEADALGNLGLAHSALGDPRRAIEYYEQQLTITREIGDRGGEGKALDNLGCAYADLKELDHAIDHHKQSLTIARELRDRRAEANALGNLGARWTDLGEPRRAIEFYEQQLKIAEEIGDQGSQGNAHYNWARALKQLGEVEPALEKAEAARAIFEQIEDPNGGKARELVERLRGGF